MNSLDKTAYCGIYCPDCIRYQNKYVEYAQKLKNELENIEFSKYAAIRTPFGADFEKYDEFVEVLDALVNSQCEKPCRVGGGCSGTPCKIMECCISKGFEGCWDCTEMDDCEKFDILEPRCGEMPKNNIRKTRKHGVQNWIDLRDKFYIWQQE
jgi:uncharacterized protein DUF3795